MTKLQFQTLYREFLFRMIDIDMLGAQGDVGQLFGKFAGLLLFFSSSVGVGAAFLDPRRVPPAKLLVVLWSTEHFLIATTMLVVGLFAVLSWDSTFPDRRDVMVLGPLPLRARTIFLAKAAALTAALGMTVGALNIGSAFMWPMHFAVKGAGFPGLLRSMAAFWITVSAAGAFVFCSVLCVQGIAGQLPRRRFLRLSAFLQMAAFCLFVCVYFMQPSFTNPRALDAAQNQPWLLRLPSYWFWGLFHVLNGSTDGHAVMPLLARRAWTALASATVLASAAFVLSYLRTLRKIAEEPDIVPAKHGLLWLPAFGNSLHTAVVQFSARTLLRSRQHRVVLAFYLAIGFSVVIFSNNAFVKEQERLGLPSGVLSHEASLPLLISTVMMMSVFVAGVRVVSAMPLELRANWIFRVTATRGTPEYLAAGRRPLFVLAVAPVWLGSAALLFALWPWRPVAQHLVVLALWGAFLSYLCLYGFQKIPFTCSFLPGKSPLTFVFLGFALYVVMVVSGVNLELRAFDDPKRYGAIVAVLLLATLAARWRVMAQAKSEEAVLKFEDTMPPAVLQLGLTRDGVTTIA
jgi:hypothetical protein